jgi:hypothetical protein
MKLIRFAGPADTAEVGGELEEEVGADARRTSPLRLGDDLQSNRGKGGDTPT